METTKRLRIVLNVLKVDLNWWPAPDQIRLDFPESRIPNPGFFTISGSFRTGLIQKKMTLPMTNFTTIHLIIRKNLLNGFSLLKMVLTQIEVWIDEQNDKQASNKN